MRRLALLGLALLSAPTPAGACIVVCGFDSRMLEGVTVTPISVADDAVAPAWSDSGSLHVGADGLPHTLRLHDGPVLQIGRE